MKSSKESNGASSSSRFNDSQHNRFNDSQHSTQSSMMVTVDNRGRLDVRQRGRDMHIGKHDSSHVAMPIGNNATVTQMGRDASGGEVDMIAGKLNISDSLKCHCHLKIAPFPDDSSTTATHPVSIRCQCFPV